MALVPFAARALFRVLGESWGCCGIYILSGEQQRARCTWLLYWVAGHRISGSRRELSCVGIHVLCQDSGRSVRIQDALLGAAPCGFARQLLDPSAGPQDCTHIPSRAWVLALCLACLGLRLSQGCGGFVCHIVQPTGAALRGQFPWPPAPVAFPADFVQQMSPI
jgi:hypothetical protein